MSIPKSLQIFQFLQIPSVENLSIELIAFIRFVQRIEIFILIYVYKYNITDNINLSIELF